MSRLSHGEIARGGPAVRISLSPAGSPVRTWLSGAVRKIAGQGRSAMARVLRGCFALQPRPGVHAREGVFPKLALPLRSSCIIPASRTSYSRRWREAGVEGGAQTQLTVSPPSKPSSVPVMYLASSEAGNSAAYATSKHRPCVPLDTARHDDGPSLRRFCHKQR